MNLGEYQTFSMMMRMKVQQQRVLKLLMEARESGALGPPLAESKTDDESKEQVRGAKEDGGMRVDERVRARNEAIKRG